MVYVIRLQDGLYINNPEFLTMIKDYSYAFHFKSLNGLKKVYNELKESGYDPEVMKFDLSFNCIIDERELLSSEPEIPPSLVGPLKSIYPPQEANYYIN